ncbi:MAG: hypothetical protein ACN6OJ_14350 [Chryseobacterium sp.]|uniref:hypothetical protein n=1 Tax=Chryseobacterium sp. TaxID=1871047 RepID=UPI003D13FAD4
MRNLSQQEKKFITELLRIANTSNNVFMANIVYGELTNVDIYLDYENQKVEYRFDQNLYDQNQYSFSDFTRDFSWKIIKYFKLLKYLENNGMLFLYQETPYEDNSRYGRLINDHPFIGADINDKDAVKLILDCSKKTIVINESIREYVNNDFKTKEDLKHFENLELSKKNLEIAQRSNELAQKSLKRIDITIITTIIIFILGSILNFYIASK